MGLDLGEWFNNFEDPEKPEDVYLYCCEFANKCPDYAVCKHKSPHTFDKEVCPIEEGECGGGFKNALCKPIKEA